MTRTPYWVGVLAATDGLLLKLAPGHRVAQIRPGDQLAVSHHREPYIGMHLRSGRLDVIAVDPGQGEIVCDNYLHSAIVAALTAANCECPDTVYRVERPS
jgi:hypothetical protein